MSKLISLFAVACVLLVALACGSAGRDDRISNTQCNARMTTALAAAGCPIERQADCTRLIPEADCQYWDRDEIEVCASNLETAGSCEQANQVSCIVHCYEI